MYFDQLIDQMNQHLANNSTPTDPVPEVCSTDCHIGDTRLRVELAGIYFTEHEDWDAGLSSSVPNDEQLMMKLYCCASC